MLVERVLGSERLPAQTAAELRDRWRGVSRENRVRDGGVAGKGVLSLEHCVAFGARELRRGRLEDGISSGRWECGWVEGGSRVNGSLVLVMGLLVGELAIALVAGNCRRSGRGSTVSPGEERVAVGAGNVLVECLVGIKRAATSVTLDLASRKRCRKVLGAWVVEVW